MGAFNMETLSAKAQWSLGAPANRTEIIIAPEYFEATGINPVVAVMALNGNLMPLIEVLMTTSTEHYDSVALNNLVNSKVLVRQTSQGNLRIANF